MTTKLQNLKDTLKDIEAEFDENYWLPIIDILDAYAESEGFRQAHKFGKEKGEEIKAFLKASNIRVAKAVIDILSKAVREGKSPEEMWDTAQEIITQLEE